MQQSQLKSTGELFINGHEVPNLQAIKHRTSYIPQVDVFHHDLPPEEQFRYAAKLAGVQNCEEKVRELINMLGLEDCKDTKVGNNLKRGISGGERKRTSIGIDLITDPSLLFLDEPTSGLDSKSALNMAMLLKRLAENGRTIISTVHSPSSEILSTFDNVICLSRGETIYYGPPSNINNYFGSIGFPSPPLTNPADHLMTIIHEDDIRIKHMTKGEHISEEDVNLQFLERIDLFARTARKYSLDTKVAPDFPSALNLVINEHRKIGCLSNALTMAQRCLKLYLRDPQSLYAKIIQILGLVGFSIILHGHGVDPKVNTPQAIHDKGGVVFNISTTKVLVGLYANMYNLLPSLPMVRRETQHRLYGPLSFYFVHAFFEFPIQILLTNIYFLALFWTIGLRSDSFWTYIQNVLAATCAKFAGQGIGDVLAMTLQNIELVNQSLPLLLVPFLIMSGTIAMIKGLIIYVVVYSYLSPFRFSLQAVIEIEYIPRIVSEYILNCRVLKPFCKDKNSDACYINYSKLPPEFPRPKECNPLTNYDFYESSYLSNLLILIALGIFYRIFAIIAVYRFCKENKENNDPIPDELVSAVKKRRQALSEGSNSSAAESPVVRVDENRVYPKDASERFLVTKKIVDDGRLQAHPPLYQNCASY